MGIGIVGRNWRLGLARWEEVDWEVGTGGGDAGGRNLVVKLRRGEAAALHQALCHPALAFAREHELQWIRAWA